MSRTIYDNADFSANRIAVEPASTITGLSWWTFLGGSLAASKNLVNSTTLTQTGTVPFESNHALITPGTNYLEPPGIVDTINQTFFFVAETDQVGGNFSPIITGYDGAAGLFIGLGWTYARIHASGLGPMSSFIMPATYGNIMSCWSVELEEDHATPIRVKNWTYGTTVTGGTASGNRASLGQQLSVGRNTIATFGTFDARVAFVGRVGSIMTSDEAESCYQSIRYSMARRGYTV